MNAKPQKEHQWLQKLVGEWTSEMNATVDPAQPDQNCSGTEIVRSVGGLWTMGEGTGKMPDGGPALTFMTLGFDPVKGKFVGTFIGSMMTHLWLYEGSLDAAGKVLTLDTMGPSFTSDGNMATDGSMSKYQDIIEFVNDDHRTLSSQVLGPDGKWNRFMTAHYRRKK
jgi:hypothetical protein